MPINPECNVQDGMCEHASLSAEIAVGKVFAILGVDINDPESVEEFREDLRFGKRLRRTSAKLTMALLAAIAAGIGSSFWDLLHGK